MNKSQWIKDNYNHENDSLFMAWANDKSTVPNPITQELVLEPISANIASVAELMPAEDNLTIQNQCLETWNSLLLHFAANDLINLKQDIRNLTAANISDEGKAILEAQIVFVQSKIDNPTLIPDPSWEPTVLMSPVELAGFDYIYRIHVQEAKVN